MHTPEGCADRHAQGLERHGGDPHWPITQEGALRTLFYGCFQKRGLYASLQASHASVKFGLTGVDAATLEQLEGPMLQDMARFWRVYTDGFEASAFRRGKALCGPPNRRADCPCVAQADNFRQNIDLQAWFTGYTEAHFCRCAPLIAAFTQWGKKGNTRPWACSR